MTYLWLLGLAWLAVGLALLLGTLLDYRQWWRLRAENRALKDELINSTLRVVTLRVECERLGHQQYAGPLTVSYRGTSKTIRIRPVARAVPFFLPGN